MKKAKGGFILVESLLGLVLFSFMLMLYLPGLYLLIQKERQLLADLEHQRLFYELIQIDRIHPDQVMTKIAYFEDIHQKEVEDFYCEDQFCQLQVEGQRYQVQIMGQE